MVVRLDRLARSVSHLLEVIEGLEKKGAHFKSLQDPIDTSTPQGMFSLQILGAVAQLERSLISERTKAGLSAAKATGKSLGNPRIAKRDPEALRKLSAAHQNGYLNELLSSADKWMPTVRRLRPEYTWHDVVRALNAKGQEWTIERLRRAVGKMVSERMADPSLLKPAPRRRPDDRLPVLIAGIAMTDPDLPLRDIAARLEQMRERTPRGGSRWSASSVKRQLDKARDSGLIPRDISLPSPTSSIHEKLYKAAAGAEKQVLIVGTPDMIAQALEVPWAAERPQVGFPWTADGIPAMSRK